jgi:hypothetical protein
VIDKLRRCEARDQDGHRCNKHVLHATEVKGKLELPKDPAAQLHSAFKRTWE